MTTGRVIGVVASLIFPVAMYAPKGLAPLLAITALLILVLEFRAVGQALRENPSLWVIIGVLPVLGLVSALWSLNRPDSLHMSFVLLLTISGGIVLILAARLLSAREVERFKRWFLVSSAIWTVLLFVELLSGGAVIIFIRDLINYPFPEMSHPRQSFNSVMSVFSLLAWPVLLLAKKPNSNIFLVAALIGIGAALVLSDAKAPAAGVVAGGLAFTVCWFFRRYGARVLVLGIAVLILLAPLVPAQIPDPRTTESELVTLYSTPDIHRILIWNKAADHIRKKPVFGTGLDTVRSLYDKKTQIFYRVIHRPTGKMWTFLSEPIPLHPHNAVLQVWVELGLLGALALLVILGLSTRLIRRLHLGRTSTAVSAGYLVNLIVISNLSYGAWQSWWLSGQFLTAMVLAAAIVTVTPALRTVEN
jgi:exopolysaccharide production protein ExoQ